MGPLIVNNPEFLFTRIRASDVADVLAHGSADNVADTLSWLARLVGEWLPGDGTWGGRCEDIAACMTDAQCSAVASLLETLTEHLRSVPTERAVERAKETIGRGIGE